jgi:hypothetical protein
MLQPHALAFSPLGTGNGTQEVGGPRAAIGSGTMRTVPSNIGNKTSTVQHTVTILSELLDNLLLIANSSRAWCTEETLGGPFPTTAE